VNASRPQPDLFSQAESDGNGPGRLESFAE